MIGRNISFILGQHHYELELAIAHKMHQNGVVFEDATLHESMKREVTALLFENTDLVESIAARGLLKGMYPERTLAVGPFVAPD